MTALTQVYQAFLGKMTSDEWTGWTEEEKLSDYYDLLLAALPHFRFPRQDLTIEGDSFIVDLSNVEIQIIATYMKCSWLERTITSYKHIDDPLFDEKDFSEANFLDKLTSLLNSERAEARELESIYYRSIKREPFDYTLLAGSHE